MWRRPRGVVELPDGYRVTRADLVRALELQQTRLREGDVVLIRTGRMLEYEDAAAYMANPPGMGLSAARFLVEEGGAMMVGADNLSFEAFPPEVDDNYVPVHTYLLAEQGTPIHAALLWASRDIFWGKVTTIHLNIPGCNLAAAFLRVSAAGGR